MDCFFFWIDRHFFREKIIGKFSLSILTFKLHLFRNAYKMFYMHPSYCLPSTAHMPNVPSFIQSTSVQLGYATVDDLDVTGFKK